VIHFFLFQRHKNHREQLHKVQFCIIVLVIIEYGVGIDGRIIANASVKCDVKKMNLNPCCRMKINYQEGRLLFGRQFEI
jgi:hypothetical protein